MESRCGILCIKCNWKKTEKSKSHEFREKYKY